MFYDLGWPSAAHGPLSYGNPRWEAVYPPAHWSKRVRLDGIVCPLFPGHQRGGDRIGDLDIILPSPKIGDFVWTGVSECIITNGVLTLFEEARLTGFEVRPVTVSQIKRVPSAVQPNLPRLWELVVTGKGGDADPLSGIRLIYQCRACGMIVYSSFHNGIVVDEQQWDGSDFFTVNGYPRFILVTERVAELVVRNRLTNCALIPSDEVQWVGAYRPENTRYE